MTWCAIGMVATVVLGGLLLALSIWWVTRVTKATWWVYKHYEEQWAWGEGLGTLKSPLSFSEALFTENTKLQIADLQRKVVAIEIKLAGKTNGRK